MGPRRADGVTRPSERGQSALLGLVLLIGMVAAVSVGMLLVAGDMMDNTQQQSENERVEQSFVELSQQMATVSANQDASRSIEFDVADSGAITRTATGNITINANNLSQPVELTMGSIEYEAEDGSIVAYQAGGVWRETGNQTRMISQPSISYSAEEETLLLPVTTVSGERELSSGEVNIRYADTDPVQNVTLVQNSTVTLEITSEYYRGWEMFFEEEVEDAAVREVDPSLPGDRGYVKVELGIMELDNAFDSGVTVSNEFSEGGNTEIDSDDIRDGKSLPPLDDIIYDTVTDTAGDSDVEDLGTIDSSVSRSNGTYFASGVNLGNGDELKFDVSDGNATLVVNGSINVTHNNAELSVDPDGTENTLRIYSTGNFDMTNGDVGSDGSGAKHLQVYGTSDMSIGITGGSFEGVIYAPSNDWTGPNEVVTRNCDGSQACFHSNPDFTGSIVTSSLHTQGGRGGFDFEYDSSLEGYQPDIYPEGYVSPPQITYLNVAVHELEVKNT